MCVVSVVSDYYSQQWPQRHDGQSVFQTMDSESVKLLKEALERLDKIDKRLKDIECNDPVKAKFLRQVKRRARPAKQ